MKRKLVIGDIHGGLKGLKQVLKKAEITENDLLIFLGDYVDGWSDTPNTLDFLIELKKKFNCIFIKGNHDVLLLNWLKSNTPNPKWLKHGGAITIKNYANISDKTKKKHIKFLENLLTYYLDDKKRLFLHAGFTHVRGIENETHEDMFYWDRTLWETATAMDTNLCINSPLYPKRLKIYKEIYIGHTPTIHINSPFPTQKACVWNLDTGAAFTGKISVLDIDTKEFWQSDLLTYLYSNEKGRNI